MKKLFLVFSFLIISGCSIFQPEEATVIQPKLLKQSTLPSLRPSFDYDKFEFLCEMLVNEKGDVESAKMLTQSGDALWDSLATLSLLQWKFTPATINGTPIKLLIRRRIKVMFEQSDIKILAEIQVDSYEKADSIYNALKGGADFNGLVRKYSISATKEKNGLLGAVDIKHYSKEIHFALDKLDEGNFTKPLSYGANFIIFKRLK